MNELSYIANYTKLNFTGLPPINGPHFSNASFNTGFDTNMICNMILATTISSCVTMVTGSTKKICDLMLYFLKNCQNYILRFFQKQPNCVNIVGTIKINNEGINVNFSDEYCAIMSIIGKKNINLYNITFLNSDYESRKKTIKDCDFYVNTYKKIIIDTDTYVVFHETTEEEGKDATFKLKYLTMKISSNSLSINDLRTKINDWTRIYINETKRYMDDGYIYYYNLNEMFKKASRDSYADRPKKTHTWNKNVLTTFKSFDNIFFTDKE